MATLYRYKCKECGYTINTSQNGDYTLMSGPGHFYKCSECNCVFTKVLPRWDLDAIVKDYSFEKPKKLVISKFSYIILLIFILYEIAIRLVL